MAYHSLMLGKFGLALFVWGLLIGALIPKFRNPRMSLSAHLTAVQAGTFLLAAGAFWQEFAIPDSFQAVIGWSLVLSSCFLVIGLLLSAATGASRVLPIAGAGYKGSPGHEKLVAVVVLASSVWMLVGAGACLWFFLIDN